MLGSCEGCYFGGEDRGIKLYIELVNLFINFFL